MTLKIEIEMDNAAFQEAAAQEVQRILNELIERLADNPKGGLMPTEILLRDLNGNVCGKSNVITAEPKPASAPAMLEALRQCCDLLKISQVRFMICDGGRGHLGEQALYMRTIESARVAIAQEEGRPA